ncbi:gamma-glutamylcyclotransferase [Aromatoleum toluclasticum]|uniref:gamma-glutamylcyclotransferase n=1 Tax=Aromatoleum toluclasticum TaxID=92003 RepID=UPI001E360777|nr:gamma-glutamylcyclotransferase [Aromatoleum toluclasticum]
MHAAVQQMRILWRREMIFGGYQARILRISTPRDELDALVLVSEPCSPCHAPAMPLRDVAAVIAQACGNRDTDHDYLRQAVEQLDRLGVNDAYVRRLAGLVGIGS